jgi:hypothetical protein
MRPLGLLDDEVGMWRVDKRGGRGGGGGWASVVAGVGLVASGEWAGVGGCPVYFSIFQIFSYLTS